MLSTQDFAQRAWVSLEDIRDRLAVVETEVRHVRGLLHRLEAGFHHPRHPPPAPQAAGRFQRQRSQHHHPPQPQNAGGGVSGLVGSSILAAAVEAGRALGWW